MVNGTYRKVFNRPKNLSWEIRKYSDPQQSMLFDDLPVGKKLRPSLSSALQTSTEPKSTQKALILEVFVPRTTHPTIVLRELLKSTDFGLRFSKFTDNTKYFSQLILKLKTATTTAEQMAPQPIITQPIKQHIENRIAQLEAEIAFMRSGNANWSQAEPVEPPFKRAKDNFQLPNDRGGIYSPVDRTNYMEIFDPRPGSFFDTISYIPFENSGPGGNGHGPWMQPRIIHQSFIPAQMEIDDTRYSILDRITLPRGDQFLVPHNRGPPPAHLNNNGMNQFPNKIKNNRTRKSRKAARRALQIGMKLNNNQFL